METAFELAPAIVLLPLAAFVVALLFGNYMPKKGAFAGIVATAGSLLLSLYVMAAVATGGQHQETYFTWAAGDSVSATGVPTIEFTFGTLLDPLSALMLVIVSLVAFLVHIFSLGYMNAISRLSA